jgi:hypothetical protein
MAFTNLEETDMVNQNIVPISFQDQSKKFENCFVITQ